MANLPKQVVSLFFGATDQDTSKKAVRIGDLIEARNCQQIKGGELSKREGFTETTQAYQGKGSITPEAFCSPDGVVKLVRDRVDDIAYTQSAAGGEWKSRGGSQRLLCRPSLRFPSTKSATQIAPMFKQSGDFFVWLDDESHFRYARQDADGSRLLYLSEPIAVAGPDGDGDAPSTHVSSFCVVQHADFDPDNLWVFWVDATWNVDAQQYRDGIWALKIPLDDSAPSQVCITAGTSSNKYILTGITATYTDGALWLAQCGIYLAQGDAVPFRSANAGQIDGFCQHFKVSSAGTISNLTQYLTTNGSDSRSWTASGICMLTSPDHHSPEALFYAFWTQHATDSKLTNLIVIRASTTTQFVAGSILATVDLSSDILPAILTVNHSFVGAVTGREHADGAYVVASVRVSASNSGVNAWADVGSNTADRIFTTCYDYRIAGGGSVETVWSKRGAWLAHGVFRRTDGAEFVITGWQDTDEVQMPYHLRRFTDGEIVTQFAYGEGAYPGGCGALAGQLEHHVGDLQQPYLGRQPYSATAPSVALATTSANVAGTVDMAAVAIERPDYQNPTSERGLAVSPGGIPTIVGGWQRVQEAGPLVYPGGLQSFWGSGAS